jgi:transposase
MPTTAHLPDDEGAVMTVMIGVDPHKGSHTAVAVDETEQALSEFKVRSGPDQLERLLAWAGRFPVRSWAVENATGLGYLLAQQLVGAGERVVDVQPKLAARVHLLDSQSVNKNDPHDARSVAIAALRSRAPVEVRAEDHSAVARLWSKRQRDLARARNKVACRLHSLLCELVAGGVPDEIYATKAAKLLASVAGDLLEDLRRLDSQIKESRRRLEAVVKVSRTSTTKIFGVGPVVAATVIGLTGDVTRFPNRDHFASFNGTAPIDVSSGGKKVYRLSRRGSRHLNHYERKVAEGKGHKEALRCLKRRISDALYACMVEDAKRDGQLLERGLGGQMGNDSVSSAAGSHPETPALRTSHSRTRRQATTASPTSSPARTRARAQRVAATRKATRRAS